MLAERVTEWTEDWKRQGMEKGIQQGLRQGLQQGRQEGEAAILLRLLEHRFGLLNETDRTRVRRADAETLLRWTDKVLTASSLEDVFRI